MQIFGLKKTDFMIYEFLKINFQDSFVFKANQELYENYKTRCKQDSVKIKYPEKLEYRTFTNALNSLENDKIIIQKKEGKDNKKHTALIEDNRKYEAEIIKVSLDKKKVELKSLDKKYSLKVTCTKEDDLLFLPIGEKVMFIAQYLDFLDDFIILQNINNLKIIRRWF